MHDVIVACADGSPEGYVAVAEAADLASRFNARLIALFVEEGIPAQAATMAEVDEVKNERDQHFERVQTKADAIAREHHTTLTTEVRIGRAAHEIVRFAAEVGADLVVLGYKRRPWILRLVTGTTASKVSAAANASVLVVKTTQRRDLDHRLLEIYGLR